ncbi:MAG: hypothetical protein JST78_09545 [Bacteroidetes bacterium]|nr:hypothetical protein [Bacteroidota bacterium]
MGLQDNDLIFASLMGSEAVKATERLTLVENEALKHVPYSIPFLPIRWPSRVGRKDYNDLQKMDFIDNPPSEDEQFFPVSFSFTEGGVKWLFPYEPLMNISSGNNIVRRNVAKQGDKLWGTVKERWSRKDVDIQLTGILMSKRLTGKPQQAFPKTMMTELYDYLKYSKEIFIYSYPLEALGVTKVVVEDYSFPFTKGENVQAYDLKLISDTSYSLLVNEL